jgi:RNA polymerase sigma-70 factor (ECF subfamily)
MIEQRNLSLPALKQGDRAEFAKMVDAFSTPIYRLGLKITGNEQDAEDVLQLTFEKAIKYIASFEERSSLATWIYRIASNEALMLLRRHKPSISLDEENDDDDDTTSVPLELADWSKLPESEMMQGEVGEKLNAAVAKLPVRLRTVFLLRDVEGLSIRDTAEALQVSETAVKSRLLRARLNLREQLSSYFVERIREDQKDGS